MMKAAAITVGLVLGITGCASSDYVRACGTMTNPPIARPMVECEKNSGGVRYFTTHKSNLEDDDIPVVGQPLDDDFYGTWRTPVVVPVPVPVAPSKAPSVKSPTIKAPAPRAAAPAPRVAAPAAPRAAAPAPAPRVSSPTVRTGK